MANNTSKNSGVFDSDDDILGEIEAHPPIPPQVASKAPEPVKPAQVQTPAKQISKKATSSAKPKMPFKAANRPAKRRASAYEIKKKSLSGAPYFGGLIVIAMALKAASVYHRSADHSRTQPLREVNEQVRAIEASMTSADYAEAAAEISQTDRLRSAALYRRAAMKAEVEGNQEKAKEYRAMASKVEP